ncbi:FAD-binding dehydrogenase [Nocardiopsis sp. YSL2]|uniref:FAD-binding dehydrogenase n=1 Tax=Nocardiopsis sp. YSL2 TaxID=2939492 RepID=UPI0026F468BE|nr:FAD-binding dehydrogenase [Nocardiopsis sp. YSL2]
MSKEQADAIVVGAGLAGLAATAELAEAGKRVLLLDQEPEHSLGGQAHWSFGGLMFVDTPEQRRMGIRDSAELALQDWMGTAAFDRPEDAWPRKWAEAYVDFAAGEKRAWLHAMGMRWFPIVMWAERGGYLAGGHGNSVPRFHITWGTGPGVVAPFERRVRAAADRGLVQLRFRHRVDDLVVSDGTVTGVRGTVLAPSDTERGQASNRDSAGEFEMGAQAVVVTSGGIGANHDLVRRNWPARLGSPPEHMLSGVPEHVDGRMLGITEKAGGHIINPDRMWHYTEGIQNWNPIWARHGIRILPGPSSLWLDATGTRLPAPYLPGFDTLGTLEHIMSTGHDYTWFVLSQRIIEKEFGLSGSEQNPDLTGKDLKLVLKRVLPGAPGPVEAFKEHGADFVVADRLPALIDKMKAVAGDGVLDADTVTREVVARDRELVNPFSKDVQVMSIHAARKYRGDRLARVASPHQILDPAAGPLIAVRLHILTRKTLGGLHTDLDARVLRADGTPLPGVYAAGEVAGFGGGGVHGYRALEGTFLGGCLFSGRTAGRAVAAALG